MLDEVLRQNLRPLELDEVLKIAEEGGQLLDTRRQVDFAGAHLKGSTNIPLEGRYATWCGTILDKDRPIVVIADEGREEESIMRLGRIGFDHVKGYLKDGIAALQDRPELIGTIARITAPALAEKLRQGEDLLVLDVRTEKEWQAGHIEGSLNVPLSHLRQRVDEIPADKPLAVHCQSGYRSSIACSLLEQAGRDDLFDVVGGIQAWIRASLPVEDQTRAAATS